MTEKEEKRLQNLRTKMSQIKAQEKAIIAAEKTRLKKLKNKRLIELGTLAEKYFCIQDFQPAEFEIFLQLLLDVQGVKPNVEYIRNSLKQ